MPSLATVRSRVLQKINDTDAPQGSFDVVQVDHALADALIVLGSRMPPPHLYIASGLTIAADADTFTLPVAVPSGYVSAAEYTGDVRIRLRSTGAFLYQATVEEIDALRYGNISATGTQRPQRFALWTENDPDVQGRCWPRSGASEVCDIYVSLVPDDIRDTTDMDSATVQFSRFGVAGLVFHTSAILVAGMSEKDLELRNLNPRVAADWQRQADLVIYREAARRANLQSVGRVMRWVS